ncbi:PDT-domain-containing protein [Annulohypoxylon maeteangense]|uniref:PDT-domain-containing protein n=1 Tax=Annulohypoxylon maeteangense TaxID=1927788 RepID=UPI002008E067|nr:PDT-domain-containing protein [Annulohypoxylon maeteangense]KAI0887526.1 PDT-domain-containing protein [Annulohypoxylon maeteangense]
MGSQLQPQNGLGAAAPEAKTKPSVCFLGPVSSYTHQAALNTFPEDKFDLIPVETIKDIFETTQSGRTTYGVAPYENSSNGSVVFTLDLFADRAGEYPDLSACAEIYLDVHHCLLGHPPPPPPHSHSHSQDGDDDEGKVDEKHEEKGFDFSHIKRIYSHPQAFGQCTKFLRQHLRGIETVDVSSTSRAAELALADESGGSAAVSSAAAAKVLGLGVLARDIEDRKDNTTRFFVLRRGVGGVGEGGEGWEEKALESVLRKRRRGVGKRKRGDGEDETEANAESEGKVDVDVYSQTKSLASFTVPHRSPGALADVLECFRRARLNLTSIQSRPSLAEPFQYIIFVEFEGHRYRDPEGRVSDALASVAEVARSSRWLGSWDSMR